MSCMQQANKQASDDALGVYVASELMETHALISHLLRFRFKSDYSYFLFRQ